MLALFLLLGHALAHTTCESLFTFRDPRPGLTEPYLLGPGRYSHTWLRRVGNDFVADKEFGPGSQAADDLDAFVGHAWVTARGESTGFRLPTFVREGVPARRRPSITMPGYRIPYYPGRTVADLVMDEKGTPEALRARVRLAYLQAFARYNRLVNRHLGRHRAYDWTFESKLPWLLITVPARKLAGTRTTNEVVELTIRPDNVIVDPWTLELTLIDPY